MQLIPRTVASALVASLVPVAPFLAIGLLIQGNSVTWRFFGALWLISLSHIVLLGLPVLFLLLRVGRANVWSLLLAGFLLGCLPVAVNSWPGLTPSHNSWLSYFGTLVFFGFMGAIAARAFWALWRRLGPNNSFKPKPLRGSA